MTSSENVDSDEDVKRMIYGLENDGFFQAAAMLRRLLERADAAERQVDNMIDRYHPEFGSEWRGDGIIGATVAAARADALREAIDACRKAVPRAHTYASENADIYYAGDHARNKCIKAIEALIPQERPHDN